jgi:hypothetical protein
MSTSDTIDVPEKREPEFRMAEDGRHFYWAHECNFEDQVADTGYWHETMLPLGPGKWNVKQTDPLTVVPSIMCGSCGCHGFITNGKWESV